MEVVAAIVSEAVGRGAWVHCWRRLDLQRCVCDESGMQEWWWRGEA